MSARDLIRFAERDGWSASVTRGGHIRLDHPEATMPIFAASTPSDHRALANAIAMMRRALPPREPKPPPAGKTNGADGRQTRPLSCHFWGRLRPRTGGTKRGSEGPPALAVRLGHVLSKARLTL